MSIEEFEEWFNNEYPLPPTVERGTVGRDFKKGCEKAYKAGFKALEKENERLREAIRNVPTNEYNEAQDDGCDSCGAWDCFLEKLEEWEKEALEKNK